jgi:hypothetical protein
MLPALLSRTDVVLELRDARLPLTSVNRNFEGKCDCVTNSWREEPPSPTHHHRDDGVFSDPGRFARVVRFCAIILVRGTPKMT